MSILSTLFSKREEKPSKPSKIQSISVKSPINHRIVTTITFRTPGKYSFIHDLQHQGSWEVFKNSSWTSVGLFSDIEVEEKVDCNGKEYSDLLFYFAKLVRNKSQSKPFHRFSYVVPVYVDDNGYVYSPSKGKDLELELESKT